MIIINFIVSDIFLNKILSDAELFFKLVVIFNQCVINREIIFLM